MDRLAEGHKRFLSEVFPARRHQFHLLAESQAPEFLFITCSDSRIVPDLILGTGPGRSVHLPQRRKRGAHHGQ